MSISSLTSAALSYGATSKFLNPDNKGPNTLSTVLGKVTRSVIRFNYGVACVTIAPPIGMVYHTGKAIQRAIFKESIKKIVQKLLFKTPEKSVELRSKSWQHCQAALNDGIVGIKSTLGFALPAIMMGATAAFVLSSPSENHFMNYIPSAAYFCTDLLMSFKHVASQSVEMSVLGAASSILGVMALKPAVTFALAPNRFQICKNDEMKPKFA